MVVHRKMHKTEIPQIPIDSIFFWVAMERENVNGNPVFFLGSKAEELELVSF